MMFPEEAIELSKEILHHPKLQERLARHPSSEFEVRLAEIALYCDVLVDGEYTNAEIVRLCGVLVRKLKEKRLAVFQSIPKNLLN